MGLTNPIFILAFSGIIYNASGFVRLDTTPQPVEHNEDPARAYLNNVSLHVLSPGYLQHRYSDLTSLKIHNSSIDKIDKYAFDHLKHLNLLEISDSEVIERIDPDTFSRLPGLEILIVNNVHMREINLNLTHVQEIVLSKNDLEIFDGDSIVGKDVYYIDVSENKLQSFHTSFENLTKLSIIDISKNRIKEIGHVFEENVNLVGIFASVNRITSTEGLRLPWLKKLDLFFNKIPILDSGSFPKMTALEKLVLTFNNIKRIDDPFGDLIELRYLSLAWNYIEELQPPLFRNNLYLTELYLQGNKIKFLERFQSVHHHLIHLDLSHNLLAHISDEFFASTPSLQVLDLSYNHLKALTDTLAPMSELQHLNLAYNELVFSGYELRANHDLLRVNLSSNYLQMGVSFFKNNTRLMDVDVSDNYISNFCDADVTMNSLVRLSLKRNKIQKLNCLREMKALCEVDIRQNPLKCGGELDNLITNLAEKGRSPYRMKVQEDLLRNECENLSVNESFPMWNYVKYELCYKAAETEVENSEWDISSEEVSQNSDSSAVESMEATDDPTFKTNSIDNKNSKKTFLVVPIGHIDNDEMNKLNPLESQQSERESWEKLEQNAELINDLNEEESRQKKRFSWYTIALILIGLSLTLTCFNLVVFFYIKLKVSKKSNSTSVKFTYLPNEVYKNTTEPSRVLSPEDGEWFVENQTQNKIFSFGRINELLLNFKLQKKDKDTESAKNLIIDSSNNNGAQNC